MEQVKSTTYLSKMEDHRIDRKKLHLFEDIVFIAIAVVISRAESWNEIKLFGIIRQK